MRHLDAMPALHSSPKQVLILQRHFCFKTQVSGVIVGTGAPPLSAARGPLCAICCSGSKPSATARTPPRASPPRGTASVDPKHPIDHPAVVPPPPTTASVSG